MKFHWDIIQGSDEWLALRAEKITASRAAPLLVNGRSESGLGAGAMTELYKVLEERLTGIPRASFGGSSGTDWGHENEPLAIELYEHMMFVDVASVGFVELNEYIGASPDGLILELERGLEIKCRPAEHVKIVMTEKYLKNDYTQCQFNMWCSGYKEWDLVYFHPNLPENVKIKIFNLKADEKMFAKFKERTDIFIKLLNENLEKVAGIK